MSTTYFQEMICNIVWVHLSLWSDKPHYASTLIQFCAVDPKELVTKTREDSRNVRCVTVACKTQA